MFSAVKLFKEGSMSDKSETSDKEYQNPEGDPVEETPEGEQEKKEDEVAGIDPSGGDKIENPEKIDGTKPKKPLLPPDQPGPYSPIPIDLNPWEPANPDRDLTNEDYERVMQDRLTARDFAIKDLERRLSEAVGSRLNANERIEQLNKRNLELENLCSKLKVEKVAERLGGQGGPYPNEDPAMPIWHGMPNQPYRGAPIPRGGGSRPPRSGGYNNNNNGPGRLSGRRYEERQHGVPLKLTDYMPRRFDGVKNLEGKAHIDSLRDYFSIQGITDDRQKVNLFKLSLEGQARIWLDASKESMFFEDLALEFIKHFTGITSYQSNLHKFRSLKWNETESLELYKQKLLLLSQIIGNEKYGEDYSKELKTQFKLGLPISYQTHMTDLDEDSPLELIVKRTQTLWDTKRLNQSTAGQVTFSDTTTGLGMVTQELDRNELRERGDVSEKVVEKLAYALENALTGKGKKESSAYYFNKSRGDSRFQNDRRFRSNSRERYNSGDRNTYRNKENTYRNDNANRYRSDSRSRNESRSRYDNQYRSRDSSWERGRSRERRSGFRDNRQSGWSPGGRRSFGSYSRSREASRERNRSKSPYSSKQEYRSSRERDPTPGPSTKGLCYGCKSSSHKMRECPALLKDLKKYFGEGQS